MVTFHDVSCQVNGQSLLGCSHQDAVNALRSVGSDLVISVCNGFDPSVLSSLEGGSPSANRNSVIRYNSQSSVDRDSYDVCLHCISIYVSVAVADEILNASSNITIIVIIIIP